MSRGEQTRSAILDTAVELASQLGLEGLSIGALAAAAGMSKSGLIAHFGNKQELQLATLQRAQARFRASVFAPALAAPRGLPRLEALLARWLDWLMSADLPGGCVMLGAATEYDDRPGAVRNALAGGFRELRGAIAKAVRLAVDEGHLLPQTDPWQFAFELFGIVLASAHDWRLHADARSITRARVAFARLVERHSAAHGHAERIET
ncbi:MAG: TetR/AcrR family transcriptional regulator [Betaproteobacteria bacterium]|nr:TetR/AcrR family transcriptional regulator [Betaproteobacteria bacterium]